MDGTGGPHPKTVFATHRFDPDASDRIGDIVEARPLQRCVGMTTEARRIVLVDDEEALVWSLATRLTRIRNWTVQTATTGREALTLLRKAPVDLLVTDVRMPGMSGIDLILAARQERPQLPVVVMTAFRTPDVQRVDHAPFTEFVEKPFDFESFVKVLEEALALPVVGFSGAISVRTLPDIVQLYILSNATGMMSVKRSVDEGRVWFERGSIVHATCPNLTGDEAFYEIMMWSGGEFRMHVGERTTERSIRTEWQGLLIESCRRGDERHRVANDDVAPRTRTGWTQFPAANEESDIDAAFNEFVEVKSQNQTSEPIIDLQEPQEVRMNIKDSLSKLNSIDGFVGAALVDSESGMLLGQEGGGGINLEVAAAGNTEVVRAKRKTMNSLALKDGIEDILITLGKQYHIIRPLRSRTTLFFYVALDRQRANLAMARITLADVEKELQV